MQKKKLIEAENLMQQPPFLQILQPTLNAEDNPHSKSQPFKQHTPSMLQPTLPSAENPASSGQPSMQKAKYLCGSHPSIQKKSWTPYTKKQSSNLNAATDLLHMM